MAGHELVIAPLAIRATSILKSILYLVIIVLPFLGLVPSPWQPAIIGLYFAFAAFAVRRALRISLAITADGVEIQNFWRSRDLPWNEITGIERGVDWLPSCSGYPPIEVWQSAVTVRSRSRERPGSAAPACPSRTRRPGTNRRQVPGREAREMS
jgi:hypothetical protein